MAVRKRGRFYYAYFVQWERNGLELRRRQVERCLYTDDFAVAKALECKLMKNAREASIEARAGSKIEAILNGGTVSVKKAAKRRLKIADAMSRVE